MNEPGIQIIIVDDNEIDRFVLKRSLEVYGIKCKVTEFNTPESAVEYFSLLNQESVPDMVITDMNMPVLNGYDVITAVRDNPALANLPIAAITSDPSMYDPHKALSLGANVFLGKPLNGEAIHVIAALLDK